MSSTKMNPSKHEKRVSPQKGRTSPPRDHTKSTNRKNSSFKKSLPIIEPMKPRVLSMIEQPCHFDDDLLTPEFILNSYTDKKRGPKSVSMQELPISKIEDFKGKSSGATTDILELLCKKDNLHKIADSVSMVYDRANGTLDTIPTKSPLSTPKKSANSERFAGLSSSPAPSNLPLPSFSFLDQELRKGNEEDTAKAFPVFQQASNPATPLKAAKPEPASSHVSMAQKSGTCQPSPQPVRFEQSNSKKGPKSRKPSPNTRQQFVEPHRTSMSAPPRVNANMTPSVPISVQPPTRAMNHSPPSNPHLDSLSSQLRMMLNITPVQS